MRVRYSSKRRKLKSRIKHKFATKDEPPKKRIRDYKVKFKTAPKAAKSKSLQEINAKLISKPISRINFRSKLKPGSIVCDASSLITLTDAGLIGAILSLTTRIKGELLITEGVIYESITRPWNMKQYAFSAVRIKRALDAGFFKKVAADKKTTDKLLYLANHMFSVRGKPLRLIHLGEAEMLAIAVDNGLHSVLMDERTTRILVEAPLEHRNHLQREFGRKLTVNTEAIKEFKELTKGIHIIRSAEVIVLANDAKYFHKFGTLKMKAYESALLSMKFHGCSISFEEIREIVKMASGKPIRPRSKATQFKRFHKKSRMKPGSRPRRKP